MPKNSKEKQREYDLKRAGTRSRNFAGVAYPSDLPENWQQKLDEAGIRWIEGPLHDKDFNADGTPKKEHQHVYFQSSSVKSEAQMTDFLKEVFGESETGSIIGFAFPQIAFDRCSVVRYMAHMDNPEKAQYDVKEIKGHNGLDPTEILRYSATETLEMMMEMEEYIEQNGITEIADFSAAIRYEHPEWYSILATKQTLYFSHFIASCRHKKYGYNRIDRTTGEVLD